MPFLSDIGNKNVHQSRLRIKKSQQEGFAKIRLGAVQKTENPAVK